MSTALHYLRRVGTIGSWAATAVCVLAFVALGLGPHTGKYQPVTVLTQSMRPTIPAGSVVFITPIQPRDVAAGDVLTYKIPVQDRRVVTHRVATVLERGDRPVVRTKGDAIKTPDNWTTRLGPEPVWKVRASVPYLGFALQAIQQPLVRKLSVTLLPGLLLLSLLAHIWGIGRKPKKAAADVSPSSSDGPTIEPAEDAAAPAGGDGSLTPAPRLHPRPVVDVRRERARR